MKIKTMVTAGLLSSCFVVPSLAWNYDDDDNKKYESSFGNKYQYDLSNPSDRIKYEIDPAAQLRDRLDVNPARKLDRGLGQYSPQSLGFPLVR